MRERRKETRKNLMAYTQVFDLYGVYLIGYLGDLTLQGAMVIGEKQIQEGLDITLAIELPELPSMNVPRITIPARVVWCQPDISPEYFNVGFEFKEVSREQRKIIKSIIENYEFRRDTPNYPSRPPTGK
jgi:Tfp pilus assembly protein PilZ